MNQEEQSFLARLRADVAWHFESAIYPFWAKVPVDSRAGGFFGEVSNDNQIDPGADKGLVMTARYLWSYSAFYLAFGQERSLELAEHALDFLLNKFWDQEHGGFYWFTDSKGQPIDKKKQVYGQAFGLYALSEFARIQPRPEVLKRCEDLYSLLEKHALDPEFGGYWESCTENWTVQRESALSDADLACAKSMNTHLHILEAYSNYARVVGTAGALGESLRKLIALHFQHILSPKTKHLELYFNQDWSVLPGPTSYGHDIEASWLLQEALEIYGDKDLEAAARKDILALLDASLEGLGHSDQDSHGARAQLSWLHNESRGGHTDKARIWWVQAEAMVGIVNGLQVSGNKRYLDLLEPMFRHIETVQTCPDGDWYWQINPDGSVDSTRVKAGAWKTPYHNGRFCIEVLHRIDALLGTERTETF